MANPVELLPLLIVALVLMGAGGADVTAIAIAVDGDRTVTEVEDVLVIGGGTASIPADEQVNGSVYVIGGEVEIAGTVAGDVVQLAGTLSLTEQASVRRELQTIAGAYRIADGAAIAHRTDVPSAITPRPRSPLERIGILLAQAIVVGLIAWGVSRRKRSLLEHAGEAIVSHPLVSGTIGLLAAATGIAVVVFMAITVLLLPVSLLVLLVGALTLGYVYVVFGYLIGAHLPIASNARASAVGGIAFVIGMSLLGRLPIVGPTVQIALMLTGFGAVIITFYGLRDFQPVQLPT